MLDAIAALRAEIEALELNSAEEAEQFRLTYLVKKGKLQALMAQLKEVPKADKPAVGQALNALKQLAQEKHAAALAAAGPQPAQGQPQDLYLPGDPWFAGSRHPLALIQRRIIEVFQRVGFTLAFGPEIEDDYHNFSALNFEQDHPAREMQDTFFLSADRNWLLRTHTSPVQVRVMKSQQPPIRILAPGRTYRNEAISARAHCFFHQIEGLAIEPDLSFADLKQTLTYFAQTLFGPQTDIKLRPSYFPFTEMSAEMDVTCLVCEGAGCPVCKHTGWVEVLGAGMVDPQVLQNCGIDPEQYAGYAFGMGVERIAQLLYRVPDLRLYSQNPVPFLQQFEGWARA